MPTLYTSQTAVHDLQQLLQPIISLSQAQLDAVGWELFSSAIVGFARQPSVPIVITQMEPLQRAELHLALAQSATALMAVHLKANGHDTTQHRGFTEELVYDGCSAVVISVYVHTCVQVLFLLGVHLNQPTSHRIGCTCIRKK